MIEVVDDVGRNLRLDAAAQRIVCLVPSLTETVFALGGGGRLVGVTRYCVEPAGAVERIERVGGTKNPDLKRIVALRPDLVIINAEENRREDFEALERAQVNVFVSYPLRACDVPDLLRRLGELTGTQVCATGLIAVLRRTLDALEPPNIGEPIRVFCPIWKNPWMSFNAETYASDMLSVAGGINICRDWPERYSMVRLDAVAVGQPEVILLPDEPYVFGEKDLPDLATLAATPAARTGRIHFIDGKALHWYGARTVSGLRALRSILVPQEAVRTKLLD